MRKLIFGSFLLVGAVQIATFASAENDQCVGVGSQQECVHLGQLNGSILLADTFESCSETGFSVQQTSTYNQESSATYQFEIIADRHVALTVYGLEDMILLKDGEVVFQGGETVSSVRRRFDPGQYTLIGRAPRCESGKDNWERGFKIQIDPQSDNELSVRSPTESADASVVTPREEKEPLESRVTKWVLGGAIAGGVVWLLLGLLLLSFGTIA